jgi:hypothetical protein
MDAYILQCFNGRIRIGDSKGCKGVASACMATRFNCWPEDLSAKDKQNVTVIS